MEFVNGVIHGILFMLIGILGNKSTNGQYAPAWAIFGELLIFISIIYFSIVQEIKSENSSEERA